MENKALQKDKQSIIIDSKNYKKIIIETNSPVATDKRRRGKTTNIASSLKANVINKDLTIQNVQYI